MRGVTAPPLQLTELHAHTRWSDGALSVGELVDLYGSQGVDVLCITDHAPQTDDPCLLGNVTAANFDAYLAELDREAARAQAQYGLVVLPGSSSRTTTPMRTGRLMHLPSDCASSSRSTTGSTKPFQLREQPAPPSWRRTRPARSRSTTARRAVGGGAPKSCGRSSTAGS
jgi:PHP domain